MPLINQRANLKTFGLEIGALQRALRVRGVPVIVVVEGWNASGISDSVAGLLNGLDPRGVDFHAFGRPGEEELAHSFLRRFWVRTPARGRIAIFARSWYSRAIAEKLTGIDWQARLDRALTSITTFERQLADDGTLILKFFLQISKEEQRRRLLARERDPLTAWMITKNDWDFHRQYQRLVPRYRANTADDGSTLGSLAPDRRRRYGPGDRGGAVDRGEAARSPARRAERRDGGPPPAPVPEEEAVAAQPRRPLARHDQGRGTNRSHPSARTGYGPLSTLSTGIKSRS